MRNSRYCALLICCLSLYHPATAATRDQVNEIARELVCLCGDCNRESLATCICSFAASHRETLAADLDVGMGKPAILDRQVDQLGPVVLATPPATGSNLMAWITPIALLIFGLAVLRSLLLRWRRNSPQSPSGHPLDPADQWTHSQYRSQLRSELERFDDA